MTVFETFSSLINIVFGSRTTTLFVALGALIFLHIYCATLHSNEQLGGLRYREIALVLE